MSWVVYRALYDCYECNGERTRNETAKEAEREERHPTKHKNKYYRVVYFYYFKCFRLVFESKETLAFFQILLGGRMGGEPAGGGARLVKRKYIIGLLIFPASKDFN